MDAYKMIESKKFKRSDSEMGNIIFRRSIFALKDLKKGEILQKNSIQNLRPLIGIPANNFAKILGKKLKKNVNAGNPIKFTDLN